MENPDDAIIDAPSLHRSDSNVQPSRAVQQHKPQGLGSKQPGTASSILVSPRQKGNPALNHIKSIGWEYSDIPADFVLGATTCALFLSLKYHRLHPEYIYSRIKTLSGRYALRIVLVLVDIENHEDPLKELSKTSLINNVTVILSWSSQEAGRYLELYKNFEHAAPTNIKGIQSTTYSDQLIDFVTTPRGINKTDAVNLVSQFGSIRTAINARPEELGLISGWGEKKVQRWCKVVREPFRTRRATRKGENGVVGGLRRGESSMSQMVGTMDDGQNGTSVLRSNMNVAQESIVDKENVSDADQRAETRAAEDLPLWEPGDDDEAVMAEIMNGMEENPTRINKAPKPAKRTAEDDDLDDGVAAALSRLRKT